ncbi:unnamed protein product [Camellia sinensis]
MVVFRLCFTGGKEVHKTTMCCMQNLAKAFSSYELEVLVKREGLLQYAQGAIAGLKLNSDIARLLTFIVCCVSWVLKCHCFSF